MRKIGTLGKIAPLSKNANSKIEAEKSAKTGRCEKIRPSRKNPRQNPALAGVRPPPPGQGKRGEKGHLAYLLRQAQAATRLTLERALADLGVTPPQFAVLTMLQGLSRPVRRRSRPGGAADPADRRRHHPQSRTRRRHPENAASGAWPGAAVDADPPRSEPCSTNAGGAPQPLERRLVAGLGAKARGHDPALVVQNCRRPAAGWLVPAAAATLAAAPARRR